MRTNAWEGIGKELKIKRKFYVFTSMCDVSSCFVRIVRPRPQAPPTCCDCQQSFCQAVGHWPLTTEAYVRSQANPRGECCDKTAMGQVFLPVF
jgi:hypothetical protein